MELALRRAYGWGGLGQSGEVPEEGTGLPGVMIDVSSGEIDPSLYYPAPGYDLTTAPGPELSPGELAAEQARATDWLARLPNLITTAGKVALTASQIAAGLKAGAIKASSTCQSGYLVAGSSQCVAVPASKQWIPGVSNQTLIIGGIGLVALMMLGGRKR